MDAYNVIFFQTEAIYGRIQCLIWAQTRRMLMCVVQTQGHMSPHTCLYTEVFEAVEVVLYIVTFYVAVC